MATVAYILLGVVGLIGLLAVIWRVGSRRRSVPCPVWLRWLVELDSPFTKTNRAAVIVERLELEPGMVVLDAGCGPAGLPFPSPGRSGREAKASPWRFKPGCSRAPGTRRPPHSSPVVAFSKVGWGKANSAALGSTARCW